MRVFLAILLVPCAALAVPPAINTPAVACLLQGNSSPPSSVCQRGATPGTYARTSLAQLERANGTVVSFNIGTARYDQTDSTRGLYFERASTNYFLNYLDASAWSNHATPVITTGTWEGPFSTVLEGDTMEDDNVGAQEGKYILVSSPSTGKWTLSCYFQEGTLTTAKLNINTDGTGALDCLKTGLSSTTQRLSCTTTIGDDGSFTFISANVYPGTGNVADQGSIKVTGCQMEKQPYATMPIATTGSAASRVGETLQYASRGITPPAVSFSLEYIPTWSTSDIDSDLVLLDFSGAGDDAYVFIDGTTKALGWYLNPPGTEYLGDALTWASGTRYRISGYYRDRVYHLFRDGVEVGGGATTNSPSTFSTALWNLGSSTAAAGGLMQADGFISNLKIGTNP